MNPIEEIVDGLNDGDWVRVEEPGIYPWQGELVLNATNPYVKELGNKRHPVHQSMKLEKYIYD